MAHYADEEDRPFSRSEAHEHIDTADGRPSISSVSTTSLILDEISDVAAHRATERTRLTEEGEGAEEEDLELNEKAAWKTDKPADRKYRRILWVVAAIALAGWVLALLAFIASGAHKPMSSRPHDPHATSTKGSGKKVTLDQVLTGQWFPRNHHISWTEGPSGEDGLLLQRGGEQGRDYLVVEDVQYMGDVATSKAKSKTLMKQGWFSFGDRTVVVADAWPSKNQENVLVQSDKVKNWRHSSTGKYWIFNVKNQVAEPLDPNQPDGRVQLASWSPQSDAIVFTRDNNVYLRKLNQRFVHKITTDGGPNYFYGIPDWVYEEEVFHGASGTWWSDDGKYFAFLRTNETSVPTFPVDYFFSRPSGNQPKPGEEAYPDTRQIKYPKAGAPMSVVSLLIHDVAAEESFEVKTKDDFPDDDRLITEVVWAGNAGQLLVKETNRESDNLKVILMDAKNREGHTVRETDVKKIDNGWFEVSETTKFVPADPQNGRPHDGYIDTIIHQGYDHLAYFAPLGNSTPTLLTSGEWEVVNAPSALDLTNNLVYFVSTKEHSTQRHVYSVKLDGTGMVPLTDTSAIAYYDISFSAGAGYALLSYKGPNIPWQRVISTPSHNGTVDITVEDNPALRDLASRTELPIEVYQTINVDGYELNLVERRPPHFNPKKKYPVLFYLYNGPGFQEVDRKFTINFQSYIASALGYIVVTLDGRGTGYRGRATRTIIRGNIGHYESHDQIAAAKMWAAKSYVDASRLAIWGWSYGGYLTLKTLEQDAGETFKYGMAVAPVTDWRFYDSIYTERYMLTPQHNPGGYENASVSDAEALGKNVRFLVMHGASDDNVHVQNTLALLDKLDLEGVRNYDVHVFPDSDHGIFFHGAHGVVYNKLSDWLVNAFNGEWLRTEHPTPIIDLDAKKKK
ncbi:hypothetical protein K461DRAFT_171459 [Myriangium duriaei CBS 260.36]|uniref:dipeptidyl-peptidase IV n=1 Tax=Myriangium duriaei CBS 260.36 TaxID=1168546 RepID=A0A9P4IYK7_9PEZI|nr:hypothetical protein K461DRAFT_171459 [Myriangium duriaei CBS 260.36]